MIEALTAEKTVIWTIGMTNAWNDQLQCQRPERWYIDHVLCLRNSISYALWSHKHAMKNWIRTTRTTHDVIRHAFRYHGSHLLMIPIYPLSGNHTVSTSFLVVSQNFCLSLACVAMHPGTCGLRWLYQTQNCTRWACLYTMSLLWKIADILY